MARERSSLRILRWVIGVLTGLLILYYPIGMLWWHAINDDLGFDVRAESLQPGQSRAVAVAAGLIDRELGMRAETDNKTALTQYFRRRDLLHGLVGGECTACGTRQLPRTRYCINPNCRALDTQEPFCFAEIPARVVTWSADHLSFNPDPPSFYGLIEFEGGGRMFANFAEVTAGLIDVGSPMRMSFRIKDLDRKRNFRRYFWKAVPEITANRNGGTDQ